MATGTEEAEKAFASAEERFLAGDLDGTLRVARNAKRHLASLPALQSALAAYEVHAAVRGGRNCWYPVLGVGVPEPVTRDHDAVKKRYRRLCLVLHPDKNRSAAADGAFKLLQRAWEVLSARHPPGTGPGTGAEPRPPPTGASDPDKEWWSSFFHDWSDPERWSSYFRYKPPPERTWSSFGYTPPPPPFSSSSSANFNAWRSRYARKKGTAYCGHCDSESAAGGGRHGAPGGRCHSCGTPFNPPPPPQSRTEGASAPPPPGAGGTAAEPPPRDPPPPPPPRRDDDEEKFTCPTECSRCNTRFSALVSPGMCKLRCQACSYDAFVYVYSRHQATAF